MTSVSNAGRKRGRARSLGKGMPKQLNRGQVIGEGRVRLNLPGLNQNVRDDTKVVQPSRGTDDPEWYVPMELFIFPIDPISATNKFFIYSQASKAEQTP